MSSYFIFNESAAAGIPTPAADKCHLFLDTDGVLKYRNESGVLVNIATIPPIELVTVANSGTFTTENLVVMTPTTTATWNFPTAVSRTSPLEIINMSAFQITFNAFGSEKINDDSTFVFLAGYPKTSMIFKPIGGNWYEF